MRSFTVFCVFTISPVDEQWEERRQQMAIVAGREPDYFVAGRDMVDCEWIVQEIQTATELRKKLECVDHVIARMREV